MTASIVCAPGQRFILDLVRWDQYVAFSDAFDERAGLRTTFVDGRMLLLTPSRRHEWCSVMLGYIVVAVAAGFGMNFESAGHTTFRLERLKVAAEGDGTYYFGTHADFMMHVREIDLTAQPPPDLALEVEDERPADEVVIAWSRLGVPEVWRHDARRDVLTFWTLRDDGVYMPSEHSAAFPVLTPSDVEAQLALSNEIGMARWYGQAPDWVRDVLLPRRDGGGA